MDNRPTAVVGNWTHLKAFLSLVSKQSLVLLWSTLRLSHRLQHVRQKCLFQQDGCVFEPDLKPNEVQHTFFFIYHVHILHYAFLFRWWCMRICKTLLAFSPICCSPRTHGSEVTCSSSALLMNYGRAVWPCAATWSHMFSNTHILSRQRWRRWKNMAQSKWFTLGLTQHIDPPKLLLNASPEGHSVLYCTALSEATGLLLFYSFN